MKALSGLFSVTTSFLLTATSAPAESPANLRPAGSGSVAAELHYPSKERDARKEAAISFYCEVSPNGKASHVTILEQRGNRAFQEAVEKALRRGRFTPASVHGKPVAVILGGTALFTTKGQPTTKVTLNTAERSKIFGTGNYTQPQLVGGHEDLVRKLQTAGLNLQTAVRPTAEVLVHVDAEGNAIGTRLLRENPPKSGYGTTLMKALQTAKFIPARDDGRTVPGSFNLPFHFRAAGPSTGSHINRP
jgi:TonB family protein